MKGLAKVVALQAICPDVIKEMQVGNAQAMGNLIRYITELTAEEEANNEVQRKDR